MYKFNDNKQIIVDRVLLMSIILNKDSFRPFAFDRYLRRRYLTQMILVNENLKYSYLFDEDGSRSDYLLDRFMDETFEKYKVNLDLSKYRL